MKLIVCIFLILGALKSESGFAFVSAGSGHAEALVSLQLVNSAKLREQLPAGFDLLPVPGLRSGVHPVMIAYTRLTETKFRLGLLMVPSGDEYDEVILYIPHVIYKDRPYLLFSNIYLNHSIAQKIGINFYSMKKQLAHFQATVSGVIAETENGKPIFSVDNQALRSVPSKDQDLFYSQIESLFTYPMISESDGSVTCFTAEWRNMSGIQAVSSTWIFSDEFWPFGQGPRLTLTNKKFNPDGFQASARLKFEYLLSYPLNCQ